MGHSQKKSGGQLGEVETTTDPSQTEEGQQQAADRGAQTSENIRYGQGISEQGMGGMTQGTDGTANEEGFGKVEDQTGGGDVNAAQGREAAGYGGKEDMDRNIGA